MNREKYLGKVNGRGGALLHLRVKLSVIGEIAFLHESVLHEYWAIPTELQGLIIFFIDKQSKFCDSAKTGSR
ncbi:MAG TPA: hypothetical protein VF941_09125 [Clostridia bacterium]